MVDLLELAKVSVNCLGRHETSSRGQADGASDHGGGYCEAVRASR